MKHHRLAARSGFLLLELALALVIIGGLTALLIPLLSMQTRYDEAQRDQLAMQSAVDALLREAVVAGGLPAPLQFAEETGASSHLLLVNPPTPLPPGWAGALPGPQLGVGTVSPLQTAYWYDVQPALRADPARAFEIQVTGDGTPAFRSLVEQFDPDGNPRLGTGGQASQLCRHVNTLLALDSRIRAGTNGYTGSQIHVTLPRIWAIGLEQDFRWDSATGYATYAGANASPSSDEVFANSSAAALVLVRRQPPALRRLDRQNAVYAPLAGSGFDQALDDRGPTAYPGDTAGARGFRVYEHPLTRPSDDPASDSRDYDGLVRAVTLHELAERLRQGGVCQAPASQCQAHELFVRFDNYVQSDPGAQGLTLHWELYDYRIATDDYVRIQSGDVTPGSTTAGQCLGAFSTTQADDPHTRYLRVSFRSASNNQIGYPSGNYWLRGGVLVDPNPANPTPDDGLTRWRNRNALSAAQAGHTVSIQCTGSQAVDGAGALSTSGTQPTCTVSQQP